MASLSNINGIFDVHSTGAILFSTSHGTSGQILRSNGNAAPTWVDASTVIGGPYLPLSGGTLTGATATASGVSFTVGGALAVDGTAVFNGDMTLPAAADHFLIGAGSLQTTSRIKFGNVSWNNSIGLESYWMVLRSNQNEGYKFIDSTGAIYVQFNAGNNSAGANQSTFAGDVFSDGLYVNSTSAVSGAQVAIVQDGAQNLQRWGSSSNGNLQTSYRFRIDQNFEFIGNSGSSDTITLKSSDGSGTFGGNVIISGTLTIGGNSAITRSGSTAQGRLAIWQNDTAIKGDNNLFYASQYLTVGVGTAGGFAAIRINSATGAQSYLDFTEGASFTKRAQIQVDTNDNMYFRNTSSNSLRMTLLSGGNFGINDSSPDHKLSVTGDAKISSGLLVGANSLNAVRTTSYFTNGTANLNVDINLGNLSFWGHLEVTICGTYSYQNTTGKLTKIYAIGVNPNGTIYFNDSRVSDAMGPVVSQIHLGEFRWDSTTSTYRIRVAHIVSTGNAYEIQIKSFTAGSGAQSLLPGLTIGALYTQSTAGLLPQIPSFKTEMATFTAAPGSTAGIVANNSGYVTGFITSATHQSSNTALFVPVTDGIKITQAGLLQITTTQDFRSTTAVNYAQVDIYKNTTVMFYSLRTNSNSQWDMLNSSGTMIVAANDVIKFRYAAGDFLSMDTGAWSQYSFVWTSL